MSKNTVFLAVVALAAAIHPAQAQPFKVGDYVDVSFGGSWIPCKITQPLVNNGYGVACGVMSYVMVPQAVRARAATAEDKRMEAETAAALRHLPRPGNGVGAHFGTREPTTCASRTAPAKGAPSADQARQYAICDAEHQFGTSLFLVTNVKVQVAPVSHPPNFVEGDMDPRQPIWDLRGTMTQYQCGAPASPNDFARTHNCSATDITATGYCYKNTFGDWHCPFNGSGPNTRQYVVPPEGN